MSKFALKLLLTSSIFRRNRERINWDWRITVLSTLVTVGLVVLYFSKHSSPG